MRPASCVAAFQLWAADLTAKGPRWLGGSLGLVFLLPVNQELTTREYLCDWGARTRDCRVTVERSWRGTDRAVIVWACPTFLWGMLGRGREERVSRATHTPDTVPDETRTD